MGFVGAVVYEDIPMNIIDYLTYVVAGLLLVILCYILYQVCFAKHQEDEEGIRNSIFSYRELPGESAAPTALP